MVPPIKAAAMLSRNADRTNTTTSRTRAALPVVRQERRHLVRHPAGLEMSRQQREAGEKQKQIGEDHPFVLQMQRQAGKTRAELEAGEGEFVARDDRKTRERNIQRVMVEQRDSH